MNDDAFHGAAVMGYLVYHGYAPDFTPEQLARHAGVRLYPDGHPGREHDAPCPDGGPACRQAGQHRLIPAAGPAAAFRPARCLSACVPACAKQSAAGRPAQASAGGRNHWPVLEEADGRLRPVCPACAGR